MKALKVENASAQERLNATLERFYTAMERRDKEAARRETANTRWIMASILASAGLVVILLR